MVVYGKCKCGLTPGGVLKDYGRCIYLWQYVCLAPPGKTTADAPDYNSTGEMSPMLEVSCNH